MHRAEIKLRTNILGEPAKHIRPLSETKAIENGANALAEGFLFSVALILILGETWRSSRKESKRREGVADQLEDLGDIAKAFEARLDTLEQAQRIWQEELREERARSDELAKVLRRVLEVQIRATEELTSLHASLLDTPRTQEQSIPLPDSIQSSSPTAPVEQPQSPPEPPVTESTNTQQ
ncbi:hypothetical protein AX16_004347 [Volvariella volvacea WC 439]|nr:hypothetical protein AX16_004347 [Volvariella volvacea WC 439]